MDTWTSPQDSVHSLNLHLTFACCSCELASARPGFGLAVPCPQTGMTLLCSQWCTLFLFWAWPVPVFLVVLKGGGTGKMEVLLPWDSFVFWMPSLRQFISSGHIFLETSFFHYDMDKRHFPTCRDIFCPVKLNLPDLKPLSYLQSYSSVFHSMSFIFCLTINQTNQKSLGNLETKRTL